MSRGPRTCVLLDGGKLAVMTTGPEPAVTTVRESESPHALASKDAARILVDEILSALPVPRPRSIVIGLPLNWLDHAVIAMPPLGRIDALSFVAREIAKRTSFPSDDLTFAMTSQHRPRDRGGVAHASQLVIAAMESPIEALVAGLARAGVTVEYVGSPSAAFMTATIQAGTRSGIGAATAEPTVSFEIRESGFAISVSTGGEIHQFRIVSVSLPDDVSTLAQVVAEEVRRSTIFFREKHRGRDVTRIRLLGRVEGDPEELRARVAESTGIATEITETIGRDGDLIGEGLALLEAASTHRLDLMPREGFDARRPWYSMAPAATLVAVCCAGLVKVADQLDRGLVPSVTTQLGFVSPELEYSSSSERSEFLVRLDSFAERRDALRELAETRLDVAHLLGAIGSALDPRCCLTSASFASPVGGGRSIRIEGRFVDAYWDFESRLATLVVELAARTGMHFTVPLGERPVRGEPFQEFVLVSEPESADESAGS